MVYEVEVSAFFYISVEKGGPGAAIRLAREHVANDWFLRTRQGQAKDCGAFTIKGEAGLVGEARRFEPNRSIATEKPQEEEGLF